MFGSNSRTVGRTVGLSAGGRTNLLSADVEKETNQQHEKRGRILALAVLILLLAAPKTGPLYGPHFFQKETWGSKLRPLRDVNYCASKLPRLLFLNVVFFPDSGHDVGPAFRTQRWGPNFLACPALRPSVRPSDRPTIRPFERPTVRPSDLAKYTDDEKYWNASYDTLVLVPGLGI